MTATTAAAAGAGLRYRKDIDGLRALAVLAVVLFHFDARLVPGGFVGVDVFFVISGFLITSIILPRVREGSFRFGWFYLRRIRRIAPAYFAVAFATLAAGCLLMLPEDLAQLGKSAFWSALLLPNIFFWRELDTGYFAADSRQVPLLHLWSLGVEEQFYLLWPALLLIGFRWLNAKVLVSLLIALAIASFALAQHLSLTDTAFAYYMLPARAGELGVGALLAMAPRHHRPQGASRIANETLAASGLLLIIGAMFALDKTSRFPGWNAFIPCVGTALLILSGDRGRCSLTAPLRWTPVAWIGLASYSLYLWHWPVLALVRYYAGDLTPQLAIAATLAITVLTACSYYLIEQPARRNTLTPPKQFLLLFLLPAVLLATCAYWVATHAPQVSSFVSGSSSGPAERRLLRLTAPAFEYPDNCQLSTFNASVLQNPNCVHGKGSGAPTVLLWGDSHAAHYIGVVGSIAEHSHLLVRNASYSTCPPVWSTHEGYGYGEFQPGCAPFRELIRHSIDDYATVILGAQWSVHLRDRRFMGDLERTISELVGKGKAVVLLGEVPSFANYDRACELRNHKRRLVDCIAMATRQDQGVSEVNGKLQEIASRIPGVDYIDVHDIICRDATCSAYMNGKPVYFDPSHLSMTGSWHVGRALVSSGQPLPSPLRAH
jgi:peptidoglycan/LPS O-acetylase OafA/YrhL